MNDHRQPPAPDPSDELLQGAMFYKGWACDSIAEARIQPRAFLCSRCGQTVPAIGNPWHTVATVKQGSKP
jgi:hypothetical protein